ncbi:MAG TPA: proteasome assembly chaperone family protein [Archaeoglobus veneficus]|nr:proteasome assembly chaperone family protein [Archaeoglobus veneficus]
MDIETTIILEKLDVDKPIIIASFPGIGLVSTITTSYFILELGMENIGIIESKKLPPIATLFEGVILPPIRIYQYKDYNLVVIHSDIPIIPEIAYDLSNTIVDWAISINAKRIYTLAGIATFEDKKRVFGAATRKELLDEIKDYVEIFKTGTISGVAGSILNECVAKKFPGLVLLGETLGFNPDPRAAAEVIEVLNKLFNWEVNTEKLLKEAEVIETQMQKLAEQARAHEEKVARREEFPMYG